MDFINKLENNKQYIKRYKTFYFLNKRFRINKKSIKKNIEDM